MEGPEGNNRVITRIEDEKKDAYEQFIQKTIANLSSQPQMLPSTAKKNKPKQPYTSYNVFFRLERAYILQSTEGIVDEEVLTSLDPKHRDPVDFPRPAKYSRVVLPPYWYSSLHSDTVEKKRRHRKRPGRMDLRTLSKTISESWSVADKDTVDYCVKLAQVAVKFYGYPGSICHRSGKSKRSIKEGDADTGTAAAAGRDLGDVEGAEVNNEKCAIDTSQWTNENQKVKEGYQMLISSMQTKKLSSSPDPDVRTIEAMNEYLRTRKMTNDEDVYSSSLHPKGIPRETRNFFRSRSGMKVTTDVESHIDAIARCRSGARPDKQMMMADEALDIDRFLRRHSSSQGHGNGLSSQYRDHDSPSSRNLLGRYSHTGMEMMVADDALDRFHRRHSSSEDYDSCGFGSITPHDFTNGRSSQYRDCTFQKSKDMLAPFQNHFAEESFLPRYGYPSVSSDSVLSRRPQLLLSEVRQAARASRILSTRRSTVPYQNEMHTPQAMLRAMGTSRTTAPTLGLGIRGNSPQNDDSTMNPSKSVPKMDTLGGVLPNDDSVRDLRKRPVPDFVIADNMSPPNDKNTRDSPKPLLKLGIHNKSPPNNGVQTSDVIPSAISSSDVQDQQKIPESDNPICLFIPSDAKVLDPVHNFPRCHCIKLFVKRESDHTPGRVGQVGLRCFYCDETCLPSKREAIYENVVSFQRNHLESCPSFPKKMKAKYKMLVQQEYWSSQEKRPSHAFLRAYYAEAASELGLVDSPDGGLVFGASQNTSGVPSKRLLALLESACYNGLY